MDISVKVETFVVGVNKENSYIVYADGQTEAICIDPGAEFEVIKNFIDENGLTISKILITHAHWDHINHVGKLREAAGGLIYCHPDDIFLYQQIEQQALWMGGVSQPLPAVDHLLTDGEIIQEGKLRLKVFHTPGHSPGGVCFLIDNICFVGDSVFAQSIGRCDLPGGSEQTLLQSIRTKILSLPDDAVLYPGHGPRTTVGAERELNPFFQNL